VRIAPLFIAIGLSGCSATDPVKDFQREVELAVKYELKDPDSAQFRFGAYDLFPDQRLSCGEVNSKNSFGGYTGYQTFVFDDGKVTFEEGNTESFVAALNKCTEANKKQAEKTVTELEKIDPEAAAKLRAENQETGDTK
jgi:hypothetical protein